MRPKYLTKGIQERIPLDLQILMWQMYDRCQEEMEKTDYLHVFELKQVGEHTQQIEYRQEVPEYNQVYQLSSSKPIGQKIFIIDEEEYATMLLAEEY